ncbi:MAG: phosphoglucomutase/phosphomannomutase family protein [Chloroflexi bacterium]|nr:phosphoglucomutase/phosphomannomutase family protein [Chloroflexota bacterium]
MGSPIRFGTDGWRGVIGDDFTFHNLRVCTQSVANYLKRHALASRGLVVGYDTRFASEHFAAAAAEVLAANDIKVFLCPCPAPTPVVSYGILVANAAGAIIITASHNPALWNGFKYKPEYAGSASPEVVAELEENIPVILQDNSIKSVPLSRVQGHLVVDFDPAPSYLEHISQLVDLPLLRRAGQKVAVDSMYGAGAGYLARLLGGGSTQVVEIHSQRNPLFPGLQRPEPITQNLGELSQLVAQDKAHVGLATDGDADRIGIVDENGQFITQLQVFALLALYLLEFRHQRGALVKSVTTTSMIHRLGELFQVPVCETAVGFKYIGPQMLETDALIGGEESGGFGFRGHIPERDGILAGLYFLDLMLRSGKSPSQLIDYLYQKVGPHHYDRIDLEFPAQARERIQQRVAERGLRGTIGDVPVKDVDTQDGFRFTLPDGSWLLIRFSGTEPLLRIYAEADSMEGVRRLLAAGRETVGL